MTPDFTRTAKVYLGLVDAELKLGNAKRAFELFRQALQDAAKVGTGAQVQ